MKTQKGIREHEADELRKAKRLEPMRKSGKERHSLYRSIDEEEEEELMPGANPYSTTSTIRTRSNPCNHD